VISEFEETVFVYMTNATGFPSDVPAEKRLDPARSTAILNIIDDDSPNGRISFMQPVFAVKEDEGVATVSVRRSGGNSGDLFVNYATSDGTARAGIDYTPISGVLHWANGESAVKTLTIPIINNDVVEAEKTFNLTLSDPSLPDTLGSQPVTVVSIQNDDAAGTFSFSQPIYNVDENGPYADITVVRLEGISGSVDVSFAATNLTAIGTNTFVNFATNGVPDFVFTNGTLHFAPNETSKSFRIHVIDDSIVEGEKRIALNLFNITNGIPGLTNSELVIIDNEQNNIPAGSLDTTFLAKGTDEFIYSSALQADGKILVGGDFHFVNDIVRNRLARLNSDGTLDASLDTGNGADSTIRSLLLEPDSRFFIGGLFTSIAGTNRNHIGRLNVDGKVDPTFNPGAGTDNPVFALAEQSDRHLLIGGNFSSYRGVTRNGIARVSTNGVLDVTFDPGTGANDAVYAIAIQSDGKILIGGDFTTYNEIPRNHIARLNKDGSLDLAFAAGDSNQVAGANGSVRSIVIQSDGNILVGGLFTTFNGQPANSITRLIGTGLDAGQIDPDFAAGTGANGPVNVIAVQIDGKILLGGDFTEFNGRTRNRITRLNSDGSLDPTINFGAGANATVSSITLQPDRKIILAGGFTEYDGSPVLHIARIHGGAISGSGAVQFTSPYFTATETATNAVITIRRVGGTFGQVAVDLSTIAGTATAGTDFAMVSTNLVFPEAETFKTILVPVFDDTDVEPDETVNLQLSNVTGGKLGAQPTATLTIISDDSQVGFSSSAYSVAENFVTGSASITVRRLGSTALPLSVIFATIPGTATPGVDYTTVSNVITFQPGEASRTFSIPINNDSLVEGNETVQLSLSTITGKGVIGIGDAILTIVDDDIAAGQLSFTASTYSGVESSGEIILTLRRTAGNSGVVSVDYSTHAVTATPSVDYAETSGIATFGDGETQKSFSIRVFDDLLVEGNEDFTVTISNPKGGATILGADTVRATIVDDDLGPGSVDLNFNIGTGANGIVRVLKLKDNGNILIGGGFTQFNGTNRSHIAQLISDGTLDPNFDPGIGPDNTVADIEFDSNDELLISGGFNTVSGVLNNRVARLDSHGNWDASFNLPLGLNAEVTDIARQDDGKLIIGGMFDLASAAGRNHIARLNSDGTLDISFDPGSGADAAVAAVAIQGDKVLVGGSFNSINGTTQHGIARLNANGSLDPTFKAGFGANGSVQDIVILPSGKILVAGDFTSFNGQPNGRVALLNPDGSLDTTFKAGTGPGGIAVGGPNAVVYAVAAQSDGKFIIAGDFTSVVSTNGAVPRVRVARLNADGSLDPEFNAGDGPNAAVYSVAIQPTDQRVLIAGAFTSVDRIPRGGIARFNNDKTFITPEPINISTVAQTEGGSQIAFTVQTQPGFTYALEASSDFRNWTTVQTLSATMPQTQIQQEISAEYQFFRVRRVAP
jgi:uncharacterized delta-60 repeat protein